MKLYVMLKEVKDKNSLSPVPGRFMLTQNDSASGFGGAWLIAETPIGMIFSIDVNQNLDLVSFF